MRGRPSFLGLLALAVAVLALAFGASAAQADTGDIIAPQNDPPTAEDGFQAGTCTSDEPVKCSPETPELFYTQAAGHPPIGFTQYIIRHNEVESPFGTLKPIEEPIPGRTIKTLQTDIPEGLIVNPEAAPRCSREDFERVLVIEGTPRQIPDCPPNTIVGREEVTLVVNTENAVPAPSPPFPEGTFLPKGFVIEPNEPQGTKVPIYNLEPKFGEPALFGFVIGFERVIYIETAVAWDDDYHGSFQIKTPEPSAPFSTLKSRLISFGQAGNGTHLTLPTTCLDPATGAYVTFFRAESWEDPDPNFPDGSTLVGSDLPPGVGPTGCDTVPFDPSHDVKPGTNAVDSPAPTEVTVELPFDPDPEGQEQSHVRNAALTLPAGMGLNPSAANSVPVACSNGQFGKGTRNPVACPPGSKIGTAEVETQPLPPGSLKGDVYLGAQQGFNPESGSMYRIFINPVSERYGVDVRLIGNIRANAQTGQLTAVLADNPQVPFESVKLKLDPAKHTLTSPPTCGPNVSNNELEPWARPGTTENSSSSFNLASLPGGGPCPATLAERPFGPGYVASPQAPQAGAFSPFGLRIQRGDGQQEIKRVDVQLPPGMTAQLRGVEYCSQANIDAAGATPGTGTTAQPPCPNSSFVGTAIVHAGSGPNPFQAPGNVYLAGPYKGAPLSLVFITPGLAGPFDIGTVVVRVALNVHPETAQIRAVSDTIPDVFGGAKLGIRQIDVTMSRKNFTLNPTTCRSAFPIASTIFGGGGNPANPAAWSSIDRSSSFRATECRKLRFKPKFHARIFGGKKQTRRAANPRFRAILDARYGDANMRRAAFILPRATILDQSHIKTICTRVQLAARNCPRNAIYGNARATSPLLDKPLRGPVYLTSSDNPLPDLLVDLRGQVNIQLRGVISSAKGRLKTVFPRTPDVAVDKFILNMRGGQRGLLVNSRDLCQRQTSGVLNLLAQNSRRVKNQNLQLNIPACRGGRNN